MEPMVKLTKMAFVASGILAGFSATQAHAKSAVKPLPHCSTAAATATALPTQPSGAMMPAGLVQQVSAATHGMAVITRIHRDPSGLLLLLVNGKPGTPAYGHKGVFWFNPTSRILFIGNAFAPSGKSMTPAAFKTFGISQPGSRNTASLSAYKPGSPGYTAIRFLSSGSGYHTISEGHGPRHITALIDPNCIYCHLWWAGLTKTPHWQSEYTITWIPLGFLKPSSAGKAAAILQGGTAALKRDEAGFDEANEEGGITASTDKQALAEVQQNNTRWKHQMSLLGLEMATPTLIANGTVDVGDVSPADLFQEAVKTTSLSPQK